MDRFRIGIIGADSPQGFQLIKLLLAHPIAELVAVSPLREEPPMSFVSVGDRFPSLAGLSTLRFVTAAQVLSDADVVFCASADTNNEELAAAAIKSKCVFLDMGYAFRLHDENEHHFWFGTGFAYPGLHEASVYGLPELYRDTMSGKVLSGMPGPIATAALLALVPLLSEGMIEPEGIVIDAKLPADSSRGAGLYCSDALPSGSCDEIPEIEQTLSHAAGKTVRVTVTASRTPATRELLVTCSAKAALAVSTRTLHTTVSSYYSGERFIRVLPSAGRSADASAVVGSNLCELSSRFDDRTGRVIVCAALDSLMKGSAGQAVQCMNRILSMPEEIGLESMPFN